MYLDTPLPHTSAAPTQQHTDLFGDDDDDVDRAASPPSESESRDMARLRRTHTTQGYRDGIARGKSTHLQDGFDEGYSLGGRFGLLTGWVLGVAEGLRDEKLRAEAAAGLALEKIFAREFFDETGVWKYDVGVGEEETLDRVVERHPVVVRWVGRVKEEARRRGLEVAGLGEEEGVGEEKEEGS